MAIGQKWAWSCRGKMGTKSDYRNGMWKKWWEWKGIWIPHASTYYHSNIV